MFLCYSKAPGTPITGLSLINLKNKVIYNNDYTRLDITPSGKIANLNTGTKGNTTFLAYRGGCKSNFGYEIECKDTERGYLHVELIEGDNIKAADVCGTSDPYCVFTVGEEGAKKLPKQTSSIIDCTLNPVWNESFVFEANRTDILTINMYDKDQIGSDDFLGRIQIKLDTLVMGKTVEQWISLQLTSKGFLHLKFTAINFGLPTDSPVAALVPLECQGSTGLLSKFGAPVKHVGGKMGLGNSGGIVRHKPKRPTREVKAEAKAKEPGEEYIALTGHVEKLPTKNVLVGINQGWQRRWLVLDGHKLSYCRSSKDSVSNALGSIGLKNATIESDETDNEYTFTIVTSAKTLDCKTTTEDEFLEWFHAIKTNIHVSGKAKGRFDFSESEVIDTDVEEPQTDSAKE